jgi:hypothetical protein
MQQPEPYLPEVDRADQEVHGSLRALCTEGTQIATPEIMTPKTTIRGPLWLQQHKPYKELTLWRRMGFA